MCEPLDEVLCSDGELVVRATTCLHLDEMQDVMGWLTENCGRALKALRSGAVVLMESAWRGGGERLVVERRGGVYVIVVEGMDEDVGSYRAEVAIVERR